MSDRGKQLSDAMERAEAQAGLVSTFAEQGLDSLSAYLGSHLVLAHGWDLDSIFSRSHAQMMAEHVQLLHVGHGHG